MWFWFVLRVPDRLRLQAWQQTLRSRRSNSEVPSTSSTRSRTCLASNRPIRSSRCRCAASAVASVW